MKLLQLKYTQIYLYMDQSLLSNFEPTESFYRKHISFRRLTEFGPPMWQAEADTVNELILSVLPATAGGQILLTMAKF